MTIKNTLLIIFTLFLYACQSTPQTSAIDYGQLFDSVMQQERQWAGLKSGTIKLKQLQMTYSYSKAKDKPVVIMLHGFSADRDNWNRMAKYLSGDYQLFIPDLPGHGATDDLKNEDYSVATMTSYLRSFVDEKGITKYHLIGNSMGGGLALQWAVLRPQQVLSLTLVDAAGIYEQKSEFMQKLEAGKDSLFVKQVGDMRRLVNFAMHDRPFLPKELLDVMEKRQIERYPTYKKVMDSLLETQKSMSNQLFKMGLNSLRVPVLLLWGQEDKIFLPQVTAELAANLRNSTTVIMPGIGHIPNYEAPKEAAQIYRQFLQKAN